MGKFVFTIVAALSLGIASCGGVPKIDDSHIHQMAESNDGVIIFGYPSAKPPVGTFKNLDTGHEYKITPPYGWSKSKGADIPAKVPAGTYQLTSMQFYKPGQVWYDNSDPKTPPQRKQYNPTRASQYLGDDLKPFEVKAGEFLYIGGISYSESKETYTENRKKTTFESVLLPFSDPNKRKFTTFSVSDGSEKAKASLLKANENIADKFVVRLVEPLPVEDQLSAKFERSRSRDRLFENSKLTRQAMKDLRKFTEKNGSILDILKAKDFELIKPYLDKYRTAFTTRREFLSEYIDYYGEDYVKSKKPSLIDEKMRLDRVLGL